MGRATIEIRIPLSPSIDFGEGSKSVYTLDWQIPEQVGRRDRFIPPIPRRHRQIREALARLMDTDRFHFSSPSGYESISGGQSGTSFRRRGSYSGRFKRAA